MDANALSAVIAYRNQLKLAQQAAESPSQEADQSSFAQMVKEAVGSAIDTQYETEALQMDSMTTGKVELSDLVTAVSNAELTLNTVVAVRDRVINAYQEILRMPI